MEVIEHLRLQYRVKFGQVEAVLYHEELTNGKQRDVPITVTNNQEGWEGDKVEWYTQKEVANLLGEIQGNGLLLRKAEENHENFGPTSIT
ncbi:MULTISPECIES: hypothetical protein [unclassified Bacillus (in: firmicutes)]|uniref:hypothetical protein n=1 Tax=unclassified Bacillus (in: firmicutes) TaxID=185979 RepID=UPI001BEC684B|nr:MULTISPECIES: hypothetical protein [unclassified Bacillus (in: firmicutes)]MBT2618452.1 hypothetical protein [Bacillus sp. ISL-78]MBT2630683.1 hypothetical protein [Bacillus sp. ISL-101]MBT2718756.1 hypothetical protein [Bacillus sp. ISL-57]